MRNYLGITVRYLKIQRRRTFLTILGIILSAALISGVGTIGVSFLEKMLRDTIDITGDYYATVSNINLDKIRRHVLVENIGVENLIGFADKKFISNDKGELSEFKGYNIISYDKAALEMLPIKIKSGRMPQNSNEVIIGTGTLQFLKAPPNIGEKIALEITAGTTNNDGKLISDDDAYIKEFKVVGYLDSWASYPFRMNAITFYNKNDVRKDNNTIYIKLKTKVR